MSGKIHRVHKEREFAILDTYALNLRALSWKAKGLHSYIMQLPADWELNIADLKERSADGRDGTSSGVQELSEAGLLLRFQSFDEAGRFDGYDYHCFERPEQAEAWLLANGKTVDGKTVNGKTVNGKTVDGKTVDGNSVTSKQPINPTTNETSNQQPNNEKGAADLFGQGEEVEPVQKPGKRERKKSAAAAYSENDVANELREAAFHIFYADILNLGIWNEYLDYRKTQHRFSFKSAKSQAKAVEQLYELSGGQALTAQKIVSQTMANGWAGLFPLKNLSQNGQQHNGAHGARKGNGAPPPTDFYGSGATDDFFAGVE